MFEKLELAFAASLDELMQAQLPADLDIWYKESLGRKGKLNLMARGVGQLESDIRPEFGRRVNQLKKELEEAYEDRQHQLKAIELESDIAADGLDVTLPGRRPVRGGLHPATMILRQIYRIWGEMGFQI